MAGPSSFHMPRPENNGGKGSAGRRTKLPVDDAGEAHDEVLEFLAAELAGKKLTEGLPVRQAPGAEYVV